jgi:hypothetical protein
MKQDPWGPIAKKNKDTEVRAKNERKLLSFSNENIGNTAKQHKGRCV